MYYVISDGRIIESYESCPNEHTLKRLADECALHRLWVLEGEHSGIEWYRPEPDPPPPQPPTQRDFIRDGVL
jgi:hypothetical protein